ncbi:MAG TPA: PilN domain-containing protein [bacterium]
MIKINLLKVREEKKKETYRMQLIVAGMAFGAVLLIIGFMQLRITQKIGSVKKRTAEVQTEIKKFEQEVGKVEDFKKKKDDLEKKVQTIESLEQGRDLPPKIMIALSKAIPYQEGATVPKKVQITNLKITGSMLDIKGLALNEESLVFFMRNLEQSALFGNITLDSTTLVEKEGTKFNDFSLKAGLSLPGSAVKDAASQKTTGGPPPAKR